MQDRRIPTEEAALSHALRSPAAAAAPDYPGGYAGHRNGVVETLPVGREDRWEVVSWSDGWGGDLHGEEKDRP